MKDKTSPLPALQALQSTTGALFRHGPDGLREYLSLATRLETGIWAGLADRGVFPGKVYGEFCGTEVVVDLFLHVIGETGDVVEMPVEWATRTYFAPLVLIGVPADKGMPLENAPSSEMAWPQYQTIHRPRIAGHERFNGFCRRVDTPFVSPVEGVAGSIYETPMLQRYRNGADDACDSTAICVNADMSYPMDIHLGGPVVDDLGRLVGIIIGADVGPERGHVGAYVPADILAPAIALAKSSLEAYYRRERYSTGIEFVEFRNTDVDFPERSR